jgi:RHS repeat-associated protein
MSKIDKNSTKTTTNFLYDENGNLLKDASHEYIYDKKARLVSVDNNISYAYNHENTRVSKTINAETTHFIYDGAKLIGEYNSDGSVKNEYIYLDNIPVGVIPRGYPQDGVYYIHTDHLGTPRRLADENGAIVWSWESEPFGESKAVENMEFNLRFAGQYFDDETSTHYNINRDYNPKTGRYVQSDPIGFDGGVNSYGYVAGNPLGAVDEMGLKKLIWLRTTDGNSLSIKYASKFPDKKGWCLIYTHGLNDGTGRGAGLQYKGNPDLMTGLAVAKALGKEGCTKDMPVKMYACRAGYPDGIAQKLSKEWGTFVLGPVLRLIYSSDGKEPSWSYTNDKIPKIIPADFKIYLGGKQQWTY